MALQDLDSPFREEETMESLREAETGPVGFNEDETDLLVPLPSQQQAPAEEAEEELWRADMLDSGESRPAVVEWLEAETGVIGRDDRRRVRDTLATPFSWICSIAATRRIVNAAGRVSHTGLAPAGTGLLISPRHVLTAAHVLKSFNTDSSVSELHEAQTVEVSPGFDRGSRPFGVVRAVRWDLHPKFDPKVSASAYDYAVITLDTDIGARVFKGLKGRPLSYWGNPRGGTDATLAELPPAAAARMLGARVITAGYPFSAKGEMCCGSGELRAGSAEQEAALRSSGSVEQWIRTTPQFLLTADSTKGQSGSPVWTIEGNRRYLIGILVLAGKDLNRAITVNDSVRRQIATWTGIATTPAAPSTPTGRSQEAPADEGEANEWEAELEDVVFEDERAPTVADTLALRDPKAALAQAIQGGERDASRLTNVLFFARHLELPLEPLSPGHANFKALGREWSQIQNTEVWAAIKAASENRGLVVAGDEVADHDRFFWGQSGKRLKQLVADAAREVDLDPGLLGAIMMAETRRPRSYLSSAKVSSYHIGTDDFYEGRGAIKARVPAYAKVRWDRNQTPAVHYNDARKNPRLIKSIEFDSGSAAVLATAVYVKFREVRLREIAAAANKDFDRLPLETRFALTRMAMAAGTEGVRPLLEKALAGKDIMIRKAIPVAAYQTQRNGTVRTAQALHLSEWIFGNPPAPAVQPGPVTQPELEDFTGRNDEWVGEGEVFEGMSADFATDEVEGESDSTVFEHDGLEARESEDTEVEVFEALEVDEYAAEEALHDESFVFEREDPAPSTREVVVGQRIVLDLATTSLAGDLGQVRWTVPGRAIRGYDGTVHHAKVFELTDEDRTRPRISFFWVDAGDARIVRARITTKSGAEKVFTASFDVKRPKMEKFTATVGKTRIEKRAGLTGMRFGKPPTEPGIKWDWKVTLPPGHAGHVKDVQTVLLDVFQIQRLTPGGKETRTLVRRHPSKPDLHVQLDGTVGGQAAYNAGILEPRLAGGESFAGVSSDSPHTELPKLATKVSVNEQFTYYVMFKPETKNADDAIWVPIAKARWSWKAVASQTGKGWVIRPVKMKPACELNTTEYPVYLSNVEENEWRQVDSK